LAKGRRSGISLGCAFSALSPALPAVTERFNSSQSDVDIVVEFFESE
jgi:hypothetical protein